MSYNLPCPSLVGILLVVSTHNGPQIVYHYPPELSEATLQSKGAEESDEDFSDEDYVAEDVHKETESSTVWDSSHLDYYVGTKLDLLSFLDDQNNHRSKLQNGSGQSLQQFTDLSESSQIVHAENTSHRASLRQVSSNLSKTSGSQHLARPVSNQILGFEPEHISEMLSPPREMCNRRFEVMLENVVFLGLPVHVSSDGSWRTNKRNHKAASSKNGTDASKDENTGSSEKSGNSMSMFHLVFVMNPPEIERNYRIDEMFYYVISKLSLVLRYEQLKHDYVWSQTRTIFKLKEEWRNTVSQTSQQSMTDYLAAKSSLCKLMAQCYEAVSTSRIANLSINNRLRSFQIPIKLEFHSLPEITVPYIPGLYLSSTVNLLGNTGLVSIGETTRYRSSNLMNLMLGGSIGGDDLDKDDNDDDLDDEEKTNAEDVIYLSLLLLDDPEAIIRDIRAESTSELAKFVRMIRPTESLLKITNSVKLQSEKSALSTSEVILFALHLIYWRRARVISPLNTRSIYIVSPMAPITANFHRDIGKFKKEFPTVPSLPQMLKLLSTRSRKPKQFASIIPSRDHKETYLSALAWLMRYGYVTQLHTYLWLKVSRKVKMKVEEDMEIELGRIAKRSAEYGRSSSDKVDNKVDNKVVDNKVSKPVDNSSKVSGKVKSSPGTLDDVIDGIKKNLEFSSNTPNISLEDDDDTILVDPGRASSLERRWINKIVHEECQLTPELTKLFFKLLKFMNGRNSLEILLFKENLSRTEVRKLLGAIEEHIIYVRHW